MEGRVGLVMRDERPYKQTLVQTAGYAQITGKHKKCKIFGLNYKIKPAKSMMLSEIAKFASTISCYTVDRPLYLSDIYVLAIMITVD